MEKPVVGGLSSGGLSLINPKHSGVSFLIASSISTTQSWKSNFPAQFDVDFRQEVSNYKDRCELKCYIKLAVPWLNGMILRQMICQPILIVSEPLFCQALGGDR